MPLEKGCRPTELFRDACQGGNGKKTTVVYKRLALDLPYQKTGSAEMHSVATYSDQQPIFDLGGFSFLETQRKLQVTIPLYSSPLKTGIEALLENRRLAAFGSV